MSRKILLAILMISLAAAVAAGYYGRSQLRTPVATIAIVIAAQPIPPYVLITPEMLAEREMPEDIGREPISLRASDVVGKMASVPIPARSLIYRDFAVPAESFRLTPDPTLEVVSLPVRPEKAVGGQVRPGQRINIYRVAIGSQVASLSPEQALSTRAAEAQLLASRVQVVDVRTGQGEAPVGNTNTQDARARATPPAIISVAVAPEVAKAIIALVGETRGPYDLWVTLAPLDGSTLPERAPADVDGGQR